MNNGLEQARALDEADELARFRDEFWVPRQADGDDQLYFCGHSLGLQPRRLADALATELQAWKTLGVEGHFKGAQPWVPYHELLREPLAGLTGALPSEVVAMNTLTVNLHLLMISFYRPRSRRRKILIERQPFPSDRYAAESQVRLHGLDPNECLVELGAGDDDRLIDEGRIEAWLAEHGDEVALVLWPGVHYASGQRFDLERIARAAHRAGAMIGFDLAHSVGNVPLSLHEQGPDFAAWCTYKYMNAGAGSVACAFVHERHHGRNDLARLHGWWGSDPGTRFLMGPEFKPAPGADAWQLSNPPILALAPVRVSLDIFHEAGMGRLRAKSVAMTAYLEEQVRAHIDATVEVITPPDAGRRGCQLSLRVRQGRAHGRALFEHLKHHGALVDWREPDIIRAAPVPLYNRFEDCWGLVQHIRQWQETV